MKRSLQLPLAIALALGATNALALGLGPVHVKSKLNQPLEAEIPVIQGTAGEAEGLLASLATAEDFERVGLNRSRLSVPLEFAVTKNAKGEVVIKVTSQEPVRDAFLDLLVEANWPKGRLLREYAILLDPPVSAPAIVRSAPAATAPASPGTVTLVRRPRPEPAPTATARPTPAPAAVAAAPSAPENAESKAVAGQHKVEAGETLSAIASAEAATAGVSRNQMMLALYKHNQGAFYRENISALKRGAILRIPSAAEAKQVGSAKEAAALVQAQVEDWRGGRASPTLVADAGEAAPAPAPARKSRPTAAVAAKAASERLELVPPKAGKDSLAMADRPGGGGGSAAMSELRAELARTKESLTSRNQETGELKSRVRELEDIQGKNDRLISLKDSEIAELQRKLKQMQDGKGQDANAGAVVASATAPAAAAAVPDSKAKPDEIWGNAEVAATAKPDAPAKTPADAAKPGDDPKPAVSGDATTVKSAVSEAVPLAETPETKSDATVATAPGSTPAPSPETAASAAAAPTAAEVKPAPKPAEKPKPKPRPVPPPAPWYEAPWVIPAAGGGALVLALLAFLGLRKRKPAEKASRPSIADSFGASPLGAAAGADAFDSGEASLREQIAADPSNLGLRLELLSIHYAERATGKFEEVAAEMHEYVTDPTAVEWQEAVAMGQEIAPSNPLFATEGGYSDPFATDPNPFDATEADELASHDFGSSDSMRHFDLPDPEPSYVAPPAVADIEAPRPQDEDFGFNVDPVFDSGAPAPKASAEQTFDFDDLPPLEDFDTAEIVPPPPVAVSAPAAVDADEDFLLGDDAIGTKLDLAKAYMDMGDPDGARSMLDEVIVEGNDAQKAEARRLLAEMR